MIEVSAHGADGAQPVVAVSIHGRLLAGDELGPDASVADSMMFGVADEAGIQVGSFFLSAGAFRGGGWFDEGEEVLEIRSGVVQLLVAEWTEDSA